MQRLAVIQVRHPLAHEIGDDRPFVEHAQHVDGHRLAWRNGKAAGKVYAALRQHDVTVGDPEPRRRSVLETGVLSKIDLEAWASLGDHDLEFGAYRVLDLLRGHALGF